jgi:signal transduction histidine kinase
LVQGLQGEPTVVFLMPVFDSADSKRSSAESPIGVVVIIDRFARDLLPLITANRAGSHTGATVLLQLESGEGKYITIPTGRINKSDTLHQGAASAVESRASFGEFVDYRGVDVLAAMEKVANISSVLVCKVDEDEALSDFRRVVRIETVAAMSILLAYVGLIVMHNRSAMALAMRHGLERQQFINHVLEATVAERTGQLERTNQQLQQELAERQRAEEEVRLLNTELDQRVNERTAELEIANKELEAFSYSVSHDLRAPLRRMRGFSTILLEEHAPQLTEEARQLLQVVNRNAVQMGELIDCLLAFSQLGRQPLRKQKVAPADIVRVAWQDLSAERDEREVEIAIGELAVCEADPLLLKQIFINLLSNAIKYSRTRKAAKIEVGCMDSSVYYVRDNGVGFDMRYRDKLFGVFKRLHRTEEYEGIGIGLAIVARIVHRHGGRVWADAVLNEGATFYFTLA